jgi:hypothetical protein
MLAVSMPKSATFSPLVDTATKCFATAASSLPSLSSSQLRADFALASVSWVVNVFELTTKRVSAASRSWVASQTSVPSTLDTKRTVSSRSL